MKVVAAVAIGTAIICLLYLGVLYCELRLHREWLASAFVAGQILTLAATIFAIRKIDRSSRPA